MKTYIKKKAGPTLGFRTPKNFRGKTFAGKKRSQQVKFNPASFKIQHKG